jgi:S1-C subfamily serine protease
MLRALSAALLSSSYVYLLEKPTHQVFQESLDSVFTIYFADTETHRLQATCCGFFITEEGLGVTSGPFARMFQDKTATIKFSDGRELPCKITHYPNLPGLAFIELEKMSTRKITMTNKDLVEGQDLYIFSLRNTHPYFDKVYVTDTNHKWIEFKDGELFNTPVIRTTGLVPKFCFGSPLIDMEGKVVAVVTNIEHGLAIGYSILYLKQMFNQEEQSGAYLAWQKVKNKILDNFKKFI